jgi:hypothetical protein
LDAIEKKSEAMRRETERLRKMKNDAKHALAGRYPDLFGDKANFDTMSKHKLIKIMYLPNTNYLGKRLRLIISHFISSEIFFSNFLTDFLALLKNSKSLKQFL